MFLTYADDANTHKKSGVNPADSLGMPIEIWRLFNKADIFNRSIKCFKIFMNL
jgi:hypothetical protein